MLNVTPGTLSGLGCARKFACCDLICCTCCLTCCTFCGSALTAALPPVVCWPAAETDGAALADAAVAAVALADADGAAVALAVAAAVAGVALGDVFAFAPVAFIPFVPCPACFPPGVALTVG